MKKSSTFDEKDLIAAILYFGILEGAKLAQDAGVIYQPMAQMQVLMKF